MGAFTLLELMIVVSIMAVIAGLVVESGHRSLERARIDAVAVDMAGWLIAMHANNSSATNFNAATACYVDFTGAGTADAETAITVSFGPDGSSSTYPRSTPVFSIRDGTVNGVLGSSKSCSNPVRFFSLPDNATGAYEIRAYSPIIYSVRGSVAIADNATGSDDGNDIKIFRPGSRLLRCVRIYYSTGAIRIGSNSNADNIDAACIQFNTF
jgi:prepilin-type N-terminal cleavage/methylation domain-containing protein